MTFKKHDSGKPMMGCLPPNAMLAIGRVMTHGAGIYGRDNWFKVQERSRYYDALQRHLCAWWAGEDRDPDTGESHLAHAAACTMFLQELEKLGLAEDDRPGKKIVSTTAPEDVPVLGTVGAANGNGTSPTALKTGSAVFQTDHDGPMEPYSETARSRTGMGL